MRAVAVRTLDFQVSLLPSDALFADGGQGGYGGQGGCASTLSAGHDYSLMHSHRRRPARLRRRPGRLRRTAGRLPSTGLCVTASRPCLRCSYLRRPSAGRLRWPTRLLSDQTPCSGVSASGLWSVRVSLIRGVRSLPSDTLHHRACLVDSVCVQFVSSGFSRSSRFFTAATPFSKIKTRPVPSPPSPHQQQDSAFVWHRSSLPRFLFPFPRLLSPVNFWSQRILRFLYRVLITACNDKNDLSLSHTRLDGLASFGCACSSLCNVDSLR